MTKQHMQSVILMLALLLMVSLPGSGLCAIEKEVRIESVPSAADVYLLKGNKQTRIGTTPLVHGFSFHSDISVIRLLLKCQAYNDLAINIKASDNEVNARLVPSTFTQNPDAYEDSYLRNLQSTLAPAINRIMARVLGKNENKDLSLVSPIKLTGKQGHVTIVIPLSVSGIMVDVENAGKQQANFIRNLWTRLGGSVVIPMVNAQGDHAGVDSALLRVILEPGSTGFTVKPGIRTETRMQCAPGYRTQQVLKFRQIPQYESYSDKYGYHQRMTGYKSESYLDTEQVFDPCHHKVPVVTAVPMASPDMHVTGRPVAEYLLELSSYKPGLSATAVYSSLSTRLTDSKGKLLVNTGTNNFPN
jgi:hypothetical protein